MKESWKEKIINICICIHFTQYSDMKGGDENDGEVEWEKNSIFLCREKCINYANILFFSPATENEKCNFILHKFFPEAAL